MCLADDIDVVMNSLVSQYSGWFTDLATLPVINRGVAVHLS